MLIGRPLLHRCCSPSKLSLTRFLIARHLQIQFQLHRTHALGTNYGGIQSRHELARPFSTDGGGGSDDSKGSPSGAPPQLQNPDSRDQSENQGLRISWTADIPDDGASPVVDNWEDDFDDFSSLGTDPSQPRDRQADFEFFAVLDKQRRERASQNQDSIRSSGPSSRTLEDTSRFLLSELLSHDHARKPGYKKPSVDTDSDLALLQRALDVSLTRIQQNPKPGYHALPFYIHHNSKPLDDALLFVLREKQPAVLNKVCYNLLVSEAAPTIRTFNILLRRFTKLRMTSLARVILSTVFAIGFEPNAYTYSAILQYLTVTRNYEAFARAVTIMRDTFIDFRNPVLGAAELNGWSKFGDFMKMRRRLRLLEEEGLREDIYVLAIELRYFAKRHMWEGGLPALMLLLKKEAKDVDHRALYWAFKLCANCQQPEFADRLKALVQEKRWPVEALWMRPVRKRGLKFGYKGRESGQVIPKGTEPPRWTELWDPGARAKESWEVKGPDVKVVARVPEGWREYSSAIWEKVNGKEGGVVMESWAEAVLESNGRESDDISEPIINVKTKRKDAGKPVDAKAENNSMNNIARKVATKSDDAPSGSNFTAHEDTSVWKALLKRRKGELLRPNTGPRR